MEDGPFEDAFRIQLKMGYSIAILVYKTETTNPPWTHWKPSRSILQTHKLGTNQLKMGLEPLYMAL